MRRDSYVNLTIEAKKEIFIQTNKTLYTILTDLEAVWFRGRMHIFIVQFALRNLFYKYQKTCR